MRAHLSRRFSLISYATQLALLGTALPVLAQNATDAPTPDATLQRVEVTGSAIKRVASEAALPVQVITREDIAKAGVTTAAEIMAKVTANVGGLSDGASITDGKDQRGFNSANLRGLGTSSTLVLLNGRRMANFASPGDDAGVDLNNIPAAALQRVEILLDGASAIYGSDAIGGVINFITRRDYQGVELNAYYGDTQEGGAGKRAGSIAAGVGDVARDGFNVMAVADFQHTGGLRSSQRKFISDLQIPERLPYLLSGFTAPANIRLTGDQRDYLQDQGFLLNGRPITNRLINFSIPTCTPPANLYLPTGTGGVDACTYNYMGDTELYPKSDKASLLTRAVVALGGENQLYAEYSFARAKTFYVASAARVTGYVDADLIPGLAGTGVAQVDPEDPTVELRTRLFEAGNRTSQLTSTGQRLVVGVNGTVKGWDYDLGFNRSTSTVADRDVHGYLLYNELIDGITAGSINPFGASSTAGKKLLDSLQVNDEVRHSRGTMTALDFKTSGPIGKLAGGDIQLAVGAEFRREETKYHLSDLLMSDNINNDDAPDGPQDTAYKRNVAALFAELALPITKDLEAQLAWRYEHYQGIGGANSPKLGLRYTVDKNWLLRASAGRGFRAPSMDELYRPTQYGATSTLPDPVYCAANDNDLSVCADNWDTAHYSNPNLKPERSRQFSLGTVVEAGKQLSFSVDYWNILRTSLISEIGDDVILGNLTKYGSLVHRDEDGLIEQIDLQKANRGAQKASGFDFVIDVHGIRTGIGEFGAKLNSTWMLASRLQTAPDDPFVSNLSKFVTEGVVQRWRHRITLDWSSGPYRLSLANTFLSSYQDQNSAINIDDGTIVAANHVKAYSIWDLSGAWDATKKLTLRAGVQNLFNTAPPFSNQAYFFISGYDPSYTDPRGRFYYLSAQYRFK
ncbi:MAG TPA: TonB-dependent receptor [Burkholderiaceae bacterium]|jgi:iron complex outermembrane receptor protein